MACSTRGWLFLIMLIFSTISAAAAQTQRVLLLHSFGPQFVPWVFFAGQFREELYKQSPDKIDLYEASLEGARFQQPDEQRPIVEYLAAPVRIEATRPDCDDRRAGRYFCAEIPNTILCFHTPDHWRTGTTDNQLRGTHVERRACRGRAGFQEVDRQHF